MGIAEDMARLLLAVREAQEVIQASLARDSGVTAERALSDLISILNEEQIVEVVKRYPPEDDAPDN